MCNTVSEAFVELGCGGGATRHLHRMWPLTGCDWPLVVVGGNTVVILSHSIRFAMLVGHGAGENNGMGRVLSHFE